MIAGVLTIITSASLGIFWRHFRGRFKINTILEFSIFGMINHIIMLLCQLTIPNPWTTLQIIILPVLLIYPIATVLTALAVTNHIKKIEMASEIKRSELLLKSSIEGPKDLTILSIDNQFCYLFFNSAHANSIYNATGKIITKGMNILDSFPKVEEKSKVKALLDRALTGESFSETSKYGHATYYETFFGPIIDEHHHIIGATSFSINISKQQKQNLEIQYLSFHDYLTGLYNRRSLEQTMNGLSEERFLPVTAITADINGLKLTNDAFGHPTGDLLLVTVSDIFKTHFPQNATIARTGGDEFVIILPQTSKENAIEIVDQIKSIIQSKTIQGLNISVSFGVATRTDMETSLQDTVNQSEMNMYSNKVFETASTRGQVVLTILNTLYYKNPREAQHSRRVSELCQEIGNAYNLRRDEINALKTMGNLHDIGKIAIDDHILNKVTPLNESEWEEIKRHSEIGFRILSTANEYAEIAEDILYHHERYDGTGYPQGLKGENIPWRARVIAVCDAFDAMTSERPYRASLSYEQAVQELIRYKGIQFDPDIVDCLVSLINQKK